MRNNIIFKTKFHNFLQNKISQFPTNMECGMDPTIEAIIRKLRSATTLFKKRTMAQALSYEFCVNTTFVLSQQTFVSVKTCWRPVEDVFSLLSSKTSLRRLLKMSWTLKNCYTQYVFKTSWKARNVCWFFLIFPHDVGFRKHKNVTEPFLGKNSCYGQNWVRGTFLDPT